jgi:hypothetical protein
MTLRLPPLPLHSLTGIELSLFTHDDMRAHERAVLDAVAEWLDGNWMNAREYADELRAAIKAPSDVKQHMEDGGAVDVA